MSLPQNKIAPLAGKGEVVNTLKRRNHSTPFGRAFASIKLNAATLQLLANVLLLIVLILLAGAAVGGRS